MVFLGIGDVYIIELSVKANLRKGPLTSQGGTESMVAVCTNKNLPLQSRTQNLSGQTLPDLSSWLVAFQRRESSAAYYPREGERERPTSTVLSEAKQNIERAVWPADGVTHL